MYIKATIKPAIALYAMLAVVFLCGGCNRLKEGDVISKHYDPTNTYMMLMPMIISNGTSTTTIMIPYLITDYEDWVVEIEGTYNGEKRTEDVYVSQKKYECLQKGSHLKLGDDCSTEDDNNTKERR
jgi:hypothetical protein